jgi:hypothetical protein
MLFRLIRGLVRGQQNLGAVAGMLTICSSISQGSFRASGYRLCCRTPAQVAMTFDCMQVGG